MAIYRFLGSRNSNMIGRMLSEIPKWQKSNMAANMAAKKEICKVGLYTKFTCSNSENEKML